MPTSTSPANRIRIVGPSGSGKSTLGEHLTGLLDVPFVELDALFWLPGWQQRPDEEFAGLVQEAMTPERWVMSGNYIGRLGSLTLAGADTVIWLDFPRRTTLPRILARSWRRWRSRELLWGTNTERFWPQLMVWSPKRSLLGWTIVNHRAHPRAVHEAMADPHLAGTRWVQLRSSAEVQRFLDALTVTANDPTGERNKQ